MRLTILPSRAAGEMTAPPSKSAAHRLLICAGLARGQSVIRNLDASQDILATADCLRALGARVKLQDGIAEVTGFDREAVPNGTLLPCRECGSTLRFFLPLALLDGRKITLTGTKKLLSRPMAVYEEICRGQNILYRQSDDALTVCGRLTPGEYTVPGDISSQFVSGLLFALPLLSGDSVIRLLPPVESRPYIDMTRQALSLYGVETCMDGDTITVPGNQHYVPRDVAVEGDWSNAAFFEALNTLGGQVSLNGLNADSLQGDRICRDYFAALRRGTPTLDLSDCPDLGPVCMALAAALHGARFTGTRRLRLKESDRAAAMAEELRKFGAEVTVEDDSVLVRGGITAPTQELCGHNDHRIVMALSVLASVTGGTIRGVEAVAKSLPDFFTRLKNLGIEVSEDGMDQ
ncbi:MAG: 3-phosphoshikimate 1-carboxyvinyltransferase [Oscillospiraceae bacterium]|nr:3-phosphoshikimate 1-carboxyvinyltransferase [Oscillospiraceae bacterium]